MLLLAGAVAGSASAMPERTADHLTASLGERIETALQEPDLEPVVIFQGIRSRTTEGTRDLDVRVGRAVQRPLREGFFVFANRLEITLEDARVEVAEHGSRPAGTHPSPFASLAAAFGDTVGGLFRDSVPREYTVDTVGDAVLERSIGRVVFAPFEARFASGSRAVEVRAASASMTSEKGTVDLTRLTVSTPAGDRLDAEEATLQPSGLLYAMPGYRATGVAPGTKDGAMFEMTADGRHLVKRGPIPAGALAGSDSASRLMVGVLLSTNPAFRPMFMNKTLKLPGS